MNITHIDQFFTDSQYDLPLTKIADKAFLVNNSVVSEWKGITDYEQKR